MPTNYLTQFATSGTANLPVESTWQNLTERATGFQTGLARSSYFNRLFAQGANAAYVLGEFVVDYASADADLDGATLYTNFKTALNSYVGGSFLPLSGGTMTGTIANSQTDWNIRKTITTGRTILRGSDNYNTGASLYLIGKNYSGTNTAGSWELWAHDGTNSKTLKGLADGSLSWTGGIFEFSADGIVRAASGSYALSLLTGGNTSDGAGIQLFGRSHASYAGRFYIRASTKSSNSDASGKSTDLIGTDFGSMTWGGKHLAFGVKTFTISGTVAYGYVTSSGTTLNLVFPIHIIGSSVSFSAIKASVRTSTGGYTSPGGATAESLIPAGVTQTCYIYEGSLRLELTRSAGWGATNNTVVIASITTMTFTVS